MNIYINDLFFWLCRRINANNIKNQIILCSEIMSSGMPT
jgi:hypothetical protein